MRPPVNFCNKSAGSSADMLVRAAREVAVVKWAAQADSEVSPAAWAAHVAVRGVEAAAAAAPAVAWDILR
eukprot:4283704-Prymnesium_polylepis.1